MQTEFLFVEAECHSHQLREEYHGYPYVFAELFGDLILETFEVELAERTSRDDDIGFFAFGFFQ